MTVQEIKEENKESNGNPEIKQKVRSLQQSIAGRRMLLDVPNANVIIVNPTHYSVALEYTEGADAPKVVAKGVETFAQYELLKGLDCDAIQGYYFAKPMNEDDFTALLKSNKTYT